MSGKFLVGIDIGGTKTAVVLSAQPPAVLERIVFPTEPLHGPQPAIDRIVESIHSILAAQRLTTNDPRAIGVSCGSPLDPFAGIIQAPPNLPTWIDVPIVQLLKREFGVPCFLENDANAGALAEHEFGSGRGADSMVFLTMGTGIGAGLILNGELYTGATQLAGEIGHVRLTQDGPVGHNKSGAVEGWASGGGMSQVARLAVQAAVVQGVPTVLASFIKAGAPELTASEVWNAAQSGDAVAQRVVTSTGERLGEALAILIDVLNPERIVIGGLALRMGEALLGPARDVVLREALPTSANACRILPASLGEEIGDVAALCVALRGLRGRRKRHA